MAKKNKGQQRSSAEILAESRLSALEKKIAENSEIAKEIETWLETKTEKEKQLEELKAVVDEYGVAADIIKEKDTIIGDAKNELSEIQTQIEEGKTLQTEIQQKVDKLQEKLGAYENADEIIANAEKEAEKKESEVVAEISKLKKDADKEIEELKLSVMQMQEQIENEKNAIIKNAEKEAEKIKSESLKLYEDAKKERDEILTAANESATSMVEDAKSKVAELHKCKESEGETIKEQIISDANEERENIINAARKDAEAIKNRIETAANDYSDRVRLAAEQEADSIKETMQTKLTNMEKRLTEMYDNAQSKAQQIIEDAYEKNKKSEEDLEYRITRNEERTSALDLRERELNRKKEVSDRFEENLEEIVKERVEKEICHIKDEHENTRNNANRLAKKVKELQEKISDQQAMKSGAIDKAQFDEYEQTIEYFTTLGITKDTAEEIVAQAKALKKTAKKRDELLEELENYKNEHISSVNMEEQLNEEKQKSQYYFDTANELREEIEKNRTVSREEMLSPIKSIPSFMVQNGLSDDRSIGDETAWLKHIKDKSEKCGLIFSDRQIDAYHTAQKIKDMSPLVVLAGVSGTGKSELPRNYAIHGGMNFVSIPVKPDWDSPASLFGYFNSIERRFEATDLVRALYQMNSGDYANQLMMVLLDEMNLAHPEQYFADLLSKLETSRGVSGGAQYDIILGGGEKPEPLKIGSNILWTGTMNEDETTKGLSDKVIDRSTLITFPRPTSLYDRKDTEEIKQEFVLSREKWDEWCKKGIASEHDDFVREQLNMYKGVVQDINTSMSFMGRNLGHRVWQAISKYICHYPGVVNNINGNTDKLKQNIEMAFADAVAFKIMPKLRGVEVRGTNEEHLEKIGKIINEHASELSKDYDNARQLTTELFQWCSADFMNVANEADNVE